MRDSYHYWLSLLAGKQSKNSQIAGQQTVILAGKQPERVSEVDLLEQALLTIQIEYLTGS